MSPPSCYRNPILPGFNPDPSICRAGDDYFIVTSTFEYFPGVPIYHSRDLVSWKLIGYVLTRRSQLDMRTTEPSGGIWAATIRQHHGRFYVSVGCMQRFRPAAWDLVIPRGFYVSTDDIFRQGSWSDPVYFDLQGTDQDLFFDDDGKVYLSAVSMISEPGIVKYGLGLASHTCEIDLESGRTLTEPITNRTSNVSIGIAEGPHIFKKDGVYYLTDAEGGTDENHQQWISRSVKGPFGPWEEGPRGTVNPILFNGDHQEVRNTGHLDFVEGSDGRWWAVFLGVRPQGDNLQLFSQLGRESFLVPVTWEDGWPILNAGERVGLQGHPTAGLHHLPEPSEWRDDFDSSRPDLPLGWYHVRTPLKREYSLTAQPGRLTLYGNPFGLQDSESPSMVLQKQARFSVDWQTQLSFTPTRTGHEAGTTIWWSQYAFASIGIRGNKDVEGGREMVFRAPDKTGEGFKEITHALPPSTQEILVKLLIRARPTIYELLYSLSSDSSLSTSQNTFNKMGEISTSTLTRRDIPGKDSPFTGAHFGLYAHGAHSMPCLVGAEFGFAEWRAV